MARLAILGGPEAISLVALQDLRERGHAMMEDRRLCGSLKRLAIPPRNHRSGALTNCLVDMPVVFGTDCVRNFLQSARIGGAECEKIDDEDSGESPAAGAAPLFLHR